MVDHVLSGVTGLAAEKRLAHQEEYPNPHFKADEALSLFGDIRKAFEQARVEITPELDQRITAAMARQAEKRLAHQEENPNPLFTADEALSLFGDIRKAYEQAGVKITPELDQRITAAMARQADKRLAHQEENPNPHFKADEALNLFGDIRKAFVAAKVTTCNPLVLATSKVLEILGFTELSAALSRRFPAKLERRLRYAQKRALGLG